jgi:hypothetical protein
VLRTRLGGFRLAAAFAASLSELHCSPSDNQHQEDTRMANLIALVMALAAAVVLTDTSHASAPVHLRLAPAHQQTFTGIFRACGFPVMLSAEGTLDVTVHTNPDGSVREQDVFPGLTITVSAPSTGQSFQHVFGQTIYLYPNRAYVGAPATITSLGVRGDAPFPPDAGRVVTAAVVVAIDPEVGPHHSAYGPTRVGVRSLRGSGSDRRRDLRSTRRLAGQARDPRPVTAPMTLHSASTLPQHLRRRLSGPSERVVRQCSVVTPERCILDP